VRFSSGSRQRGSLERSVKAGTRLAVVVALLGQLAALAHGALVEHVTCGADGELVHVRAEPASPAPARDAAREASSGEGDPHDHCLLDEEGEALCPNSYASPGEPVSPSRSRHPVARRVRVTSEPTPLYRLAPKNSPPA
jgi:hypothetical protein